MRIMHRQSACLRPFLPSVVGENWRSCADLMKSCNEFNWADDVIRFLPPCLGSRDVKMVNRLNAFICNWFNRVESLLRLPKKAQYFPFRPICPKRLQSIRSTKRSGCSSVCSSLGSNQRRLGSATMAMNFGYLRRAFKAHRHYHRLWRQRIENAGDFTSRHQADRGDLFLNVAVKNNELKLTTVLEARRYLVGFIPAGTKIVVRKIFTLQKL